MRKGFIFLIASTGCWFLWRRNSLFVPDRIWSVNNTDSPSVVDFNVLGDIDEYFLKHTSNNT